jgi:hypothetical protein
MIQDYDYCTVTAKPKKSPKKAVRHKSCAVQTMYSNSQAQTLQYAEVDTNTERGKKQLETFKPVGAEVQYSAVKVKTYPEGNVMRTLLQYCLFPLGIYCTCSGGSLTLLLSKWLLEFSLFQMSY